jgi:predicted TIM-barrel fold metal-dependent hydrolase
MPATIIDCDVHPYVNKLADVVAYMPQAWQERFRSQNVELSGRSVHRYPHPAGGSLRKDAVPPGGGLPGSDPDYVASDLLDRYDLAAALLIPIQASAVSAWTDATRADVFTEAINRYVVEHWPSVDSRYRICVTASPHDTEHAAAEVRRWRDAASVVAVSLPLLDTMMGNKHYYPIYEAAQECGMPIVVHPTGAEGSYLGAPTIAGGIPRTYAERHALVPQVAQANLASLVFEGVFDRFPELRIAFVEWGFSWLGPFMWRLDQEWRNFRSDVPWVKKPPSEYIHDAVKFTTQPFDDLSNPEDLWPFLDLIDAEKTLMFSSDYPHYDNDDPHIVSRRLLPKKSREAITSKNAREMFSARL